MLGPKFGTIKEFFRNQTIFKEGQVGNVGYLIRTGEVTIYKIIDDEKKILSKLGPGEVFGEMGIVTQTPRTACAEASEYCELVVIDKETMLKMLKKSPKLIQSITLFLMKRLANTLEMLDDHNDETLSPKKITSVCNLLSLISKYNEEVNYNSFCKKAIDITQVSQMEIDLIIKRLFELKAIDIDGDQQNTKTSGCIIRVTDNEKLIQKGKY